MYQSNLDLSQIQILILTLEKKITLDFTFS